MARCTDVARLLAVAVGASGCLTGHLLDVARRVEQPQSFQSATVAGDLLVVRYRALVTDDLGTPLGTTDRTASIDLTPLRGCSCVTADALTVSWSSAPQPTASPPGDAPQTRPVRIDRSADGSMLLLVGGDVPPIPANAFTRLDHAPWVWPLVPFAAAADVVVVPPLVVFAPAVITMGD